MRVDFHRTRGSMPAPGADSLAVLVLYALGVAGLAAIAGS
jgi:hypothetical protein